MALPGEAPLWYRLARTCIFKMDAEHAHEWTVRSLKLMQSVPPMRAALRANWTVSSEALEQSLFGQEFCNPVGLAAGFDKEGRIAKGMSALGFGFLELGTVTPLAQPGNDRPRMFRVPECGSLVNRLGFNNGGAQELASRLQTLRPFCVPLGINLGKNKVTPNESALRDYEQLAEAFGPMADYLVINVSSPNTPGLRDLQNETFLREVFAATLSKTSAPILLKITPDSEPEVAAQLARAALEAGAAGVIATNTTNDPGFHERYSRPGRALAGGVSGDHLREKSFAVFDAVASEVFGGGVLIAVGGISSSAEAYRRIRAGANLVQIYTALVFQGPGLIKRINRGLLAELDRSGFASVGEACGADRV